MIHFVARDGERFFLDFGFNVCAYTCYTQAHLGLGLQPNNAAHTIPKPKPQAALKPIEQKIFINSYHPRPLDHT